MNFYSTTKYPEKIKEERNTKQNYALFIFPNFLEN